MNTDYQKLIPDNFSADSKVWVFQSDRQFTAEEVKSIKNELSEFKNQWAAHGIRLFSFVDLFFDRFIVMMADGSVVKICGGSTDDSTRFMKKLEKDYSVKLLDRQLLAFIINDKIEIVPMAAIGSKIESGEITGDTLYFNNTILTRQDLTDKWIVPVKDSWLAKRLPQFSDVL